MFTVLRIFERGSQSRDLVFGFQGTQRASGQCPDIIVEVLLHGCSQRLLGRRIHLDFRPDDRRIRLEEHTFYLPEKCMKRTGVFDRNVEPKQRIDRLQAHIFLEIRSQGVGQKWNGIAVANAAERRDYRGAYIALRLFFQSLAELWDRIPISQHSQLFDSSLTLLRAGAIE